MKLEDRTSQPYKFYKEEKTKLECFLNDLRQICIFLPKFHCELISIKRSLVQAK